MKRSLEFIVAVAIGIVLAQMLDVFPFSTKGDRRFLLYSIQRELQVGQTKTEIDEVIQTHQAPFLHRIDSDQQILLRVDTGAANSVLLTVALSDGNLRSSRIRGEDGPEEIFHDAPPDIATK